MRVLVTGFEPFGPWQRNPSGETAHHLDGATIVDAEITAALHTFHFSTPIARGQYSASVHTRTLFIPQSPTPNSTN